MNTSAFSLYLAPFLWRRWRGHFKPGADILSSEDITGKLFYTITVFTLTLIWEKTVDINS